MLISSLCIITVTGKFNLPGLCIKCTRVCAKSTSPRAVKDQVILHYVATMMAILKITVCKFGQSVAKFTAWCCQAQCII